MRTARRRLLSLPSALVALSLGPACPSQPVDSGCELVVVSGAVGVRTYGCSDGQGCSPPNLDAIDGGIYQQYPSGDCELLVAYDGTYTVDYC